MEYARDQKNIIHDGKKCREKEKTDYDKARK